MRVYEGTPAEIAEYFGKPQLNPIVESGTVTRSEVNLWTRERLAELWSNASGKQKRLLKLIIVSKDGRIPIAEAQKHLGLKPGPAIAGVLANITRNARRITKYSEARLVDWSKEEKGGVTTWWYQIPDPVLTMLRQVIQKSA